MIETIAALRPTWNNGVSERQWKSDLRLYIGPALGSARIDKVTTADLIRLIEPIWMEKRPTAERLRYRLSIIMQRAIGKGYRTDDPAGAQLIGSLPKARREVAHMVAVPHSEVPAAVRKIRETRKHWALPAVVEFVILTGVRSGEATGATWQEIDFESQTWTVPGARMKVRKPHTVPLSDRAIEILETARAQGNGSPLIFPSARGGKEMKSQVIVRFIKSLGIDATVHGFRSSFRDWCSDNGIVREVAEAALAHTVKGVEGAYARSDLLDRRRPTMEAWSRHVAGTEGETVIDFTAAPHGVATEYRNGRPSTATARSTRAARTATGATRAARTATRATRGAHTALISGRRADFRGDPLGS